MKIGNYPLHAKLLPEDKLIWENCLKNNAIIINDESPVVLYRQYTGQVTSVQEFKENTINFKQNLDFTNQYNVNDYVFSINYI